MKKIFYIIIISLLLTSCTDNKNAMKALKQDGYTNIKLTGYSMWSCSESDNFSTGFTATKNGYKIKGVVCSGWTKGSTIRTF